MYAADHSIIAARLSGLYLVDKTARKDEKYLYRVYIPAPETEIFKADTASAFSGISEYQPLPEPVELKARWNDKAVELSWNIQYLNHIYNSYVIEKSTDGERYTPLSDRATVQLADQGISPTRAYKTDTLDNNKTTYYYRVRGINAFGETGPPCKPLSGKGHVPISQPPVITGSEVIDNRKIQLQWTYPEHMNTYINGFSIYRSSKPDAPKEKVHQSRISTARSYMDDRPGLTNYYTISVFNDEQEALSPMVTYVELVDSVPPIPPTGFTGMIDSTGRVYLHWAHNTDGDIDGYRIYKANRPDFEFMLAHPSVIKDTVFVDSVNLKILDDKAYYKLRAVDLRQNQSACSELLTLNKPDIIPPVSPVLRSVEAQKKALVITWVNSSSTDVTQHYIFRQVPGDTTYVLLAGMDKTDGIYATYTDPDIQPGKIYRYRIVAEDRSGLHSIPSKPMQGKVASGITENVHLKIQEEYSDRAVLSWTITSDKEVVRVLVYRAVGNSPLQLYGNATDTYTDHNLVPEKSYTYRIKAVFSDESISDLSNSIKIEN